MQFANTERSTWDSNNLSYSREHATIKTTKPTSAGEPCLLFYNCSPTAWREITGRVIGLLAIDNIEPTEDSTSGMGKEGGQYLTEIMTSFEGRATAPHMWQEARKLWPGGTTELHVFSANTGAIHFYRKLGAKVSSYYTTNTHGEPKLNKMEEAMHTPINSYSQHHHATR